MKILLADDSVTAQNMGKKILAEAGHEVICVSNGAAALKKVSEQEPDLVIVDIYMPGYSGLEVCQRLKEANATAHLPVVLTVGKLEPFRKEEAQRVHAEALIVKPFEASELAAAVARFAEIGAAANSAKPKGRGKLGPQPKPKPQWEEAPEDEFVNTTQKLQEQMEDEAAGSAMPSPASADEAQPAPEAQGFHPAARQESYAASPSDGVERGAAPSPETEVENAASPATEFSVTPQHELSPAGESEERAPMAARAAAAAAGAEAGDAVAAVNSPEGFAITPPAEPVMGVGAPFAVPTFPSGSEMASGAGAELSAAADAVSVPAVDPAFEPDRTQWVSQFATRFGIAQEASQEAPADEAEPEAAHLESPASEQPVSEPRASEQAASQQPASEALPAAPSDEISAILSNLPGGMVSPKPSPAAEGGAEFGQRPWPVGSSGNDPEWKAEEVPVEDRDNSVSLAEEMEKAFRTADSELRVRFAEPEQETASQEATSEAVESHENVEREEQPAPVPAVWVSPSEPSSSVEQPAEVPAAPPIEETKPPQPEADRIAGVMQSAAMAIATRATVSAVTSQLHTSPADTADSATGPSAIEELVGQVLERLKPKLIAEVKRELENSEEK